MTGNPKEASNKLWRLGGGVGAAEILPNGDLQMRGHGIVFSHPGGDDRTGSYENKRQDGEPIKDLYGTWFGRPRSFLDPDGDVEIGTDLHIPSYVDGYNAQTGELMGGLPINLLYDHGIGPFGSRSFGRAIPTRVTDEGLEYLITVERKRAQEYLELVLELKNDGWLGLSTQTAASVADMDWLTGQIKSWMPIELSLTPTPAEPRTIDHMRSASPDVFLQHQQRMQEFLTALYRKYEVINLMTKKPDLIPEEQEPENVDTTPVVTDGEPARSAADLVDEAFDSIDADLEAETTDAPDADEPTRNAKIEDLTVRLDAFQGAIEEMARSLATLGEQLQESTDQGNEAMTLMVTRMGKLFAKHIRTAPLQAASKTDEEDDESEDTPPARTARSVKVSSYGLPTDAPGQ